MLLQAVDPERDVYFVSLQNMSTSRASSDTRAQARQNPSSLVRFLVVSQYLLELASDVWVLECGVLTSGGA